jgi:outer membrane protein OmpA-like peptidoglycan-associated protein
MNGTACASRVAAIRHFALAAWVLGAIAHSPPAAAAPQDTDLAGVTADISYLRQYNGVLHVGIVLHNAGAKEAASHQALDYSQVVVIDAKANKKFFPLKDANGNFLAGPISDWNGGGRWFPRLEPGSDTLVWLLFDTVSVGNPLRIEGPFFHSFSGPAVTNAPPAAGQDVTSSVPPLRASVQSATRAEGQLKVRLKIVNPASARIGSHTVSYKDAYALDPQGKRNYPLLRDSQGLFLATPMADKNEGGRWFLSRIEPNGLATIDLTFQAPPDNVKTVDIIFPWFGPFEAVAISGEGGAADSGIAVAGRSADLERVLKDLNAEVTAQQIKVNLSADLLFDFDKADIKPAAEPELGKVVTVVKSYPDAQVLIEGHTDGKGSDAYNQPLSERRAATVAQWLAAHAGINSARLQVRGWGKTKPVAPNANPDGSDNPEGRGKNRRVEITVSKK